MIKNVEKLENEKNELVNTLNEHKMSIKKVGDLQNKVDELANTKVQLEKERNGLLDTVNRQEVITSKVNDLEKVKSELEVRLNNLSREAEENSKRLNQEIRTISDENKDLKVRLNSIAADNTNLATEKVELEKTIEEHQVLVNEKHVTFQRIGSQNKLVDFNELDSSLEKSPVAKGSESEGKGLSPESPGTSLEKSELNEVNTVQKRSLESPGNSPDKKI